MNTQILNLSPQRIAAIAVNLSIAAILTTSLGSLIKSPPIIAQELRIAQGGAISPIIAGSRVKDDIKNISTDFDKSVKDRYRNS